RPGQAAADAPALLGWSRLRELRSASDLPNRRRSRCFSELEGEDEMSGFKRYWKTVLPILCLLVLSIGIYGVVIKDRGRHHGSSPWGEDYFPNVPLVTQDGKTVHFFDDLIKGRVVAIDFIFTSCGQVCPLEAARLSEVQKLLGDRVGRDVFFYSISID